MAVRKAAVDYKDFEEFGKFLDNWSKELGRTGFINLFENPKIVTAIAQWIGDEIEEAVGHDAFGRFMAERTYVEVVPSARGITFHIGGYTEQEMKDMGRNHRLTEGSKKDYNLWEMYEFHGGAVGTKGIPVGVNKKQAISKDVAGPLAIRTKTGGSQELKGRRGLINSVLGQIRSELIIKLIDILEDAGGLAVASAAAAAAARSKALQGLHGDVRTQVRKLAKRLDVDLAKLGYNEQYITVGSTGMLSVRSSSGTIVSSALTGKRISATK